MWQVARWIGGAPIAPIERQSTIMTHIPFLSSHTILALSTLSPSRALTGLTHPLLITHQAIRCRCIKSTHARITAYDPGAHPTYPRTQGVHANGRFASVTHVE